MTRSVKQTLTDFHALIRNWEDDLAHTDRDLTAPDAVESAEYKLKLLKDAETYLNALYTALRIIIK